MLPVVVAIVPIFLLIVMGFVLRRVLLKEEVLWDGTEQLVYYVLFPALLFLTLQTALAIITMPVAIGLLA